MPANVNTAEEQNIFSKQTASSHAST